MRDDSKLASKIKAHISRFAHRVTEGLGRVERRFVSEMLYGIQAAKDLKVSEIARSLNEEIALLQTEKRLCRHLARKDLTGAVNRWTCWEGGGEVDEETVLAIDLGDLRKSYAKKMEYLGGIRDGSTGELAKGYWLCEVIAAHPYGEKIVPLYGELYAHEAEEFSSENDQLLKAIRSVSVATDQKGIFALDRGGDRSKIIKPLIDGQLRFVIRQDGDRHVLLPGGKKCAVARAARWCKVTSRRTVEVEREGYREKKHLRLGSLSVGLPERAKVPLWLVTIRGLAPHPILLLTNVPPQPGRDHAVWIADVYLTRWKCEEAYRFLKQSYHLEDVRVRSYTALRNSYALLHAIFYFVSVVIGQKAKLNLIFKRVCQKAKRFYEVATFYQYAVADGIYRLLFASRTGPKRTEQGSAQGQLLLGFARPPS